MTKVPSQQNCMMSSSINMIGSCDLADYLIRSSYLLIDHQTQQLGVVNWSVLISVLVSQHLLPKCENVHFHLPRTATTNPTTTNPTTLLQLKPLKLTSIYIIIQASLQAKVLVNFCSCKVTDYTQSYTRYIASIGSCQLYRTLTWIHVYMLPSVLYSICPRLPWYNTVCSMSITLQVVYYTMLDSKGPTKIIKALVIDRRWWVTEQWVCTMV